MVVAALALFSAACNSAATSGRTDSTTVTSNDLAAAHMGDSTSATGTDSAAAPSWALLPFTKVDSVNPIIRRSPGKRRMSSTRRPSSKTARSISFTAHRIGSVTPQAPPVSAWQAVLMGCTSREPGRPYFIPIMTARKNGNGKGGAKIPGWWKTKRAFIT